MAASVARFSGGGRHELLSVKSVECVASCHLPEPNHLSYTLVAI